MSSYRPLRFVDASARADEVVANDKLGIGTHSQTSELHIKADAPEIRVQDEVSAVTESALRITANSGTISFQSGIDFTEDSKGDFKFESMQGGTTHMTIDGSSGNVEVGTANLFVDALTGRVGVGVTEPTSRFEVAGDETVQEYPPRAMTDYETYMEGHGVFRVSQSSVRSGEDGAYALFNKDDGTTFWHSDNESTDHQYTLDADGTYDGISSFAGISGEWVKLECPHGVKLNEVTLHLRSLSYQDQSPEDWTLLASNDDNNWDTLKTVSGQIISSSGTTFSVNATQYYKFFTIVVTRIANNVAGSYTNALVFGEWRLFGTPAPSSLEDGHLTLGKALTLPRVSGHAAGAETPRADSLVVHYDTTVDSVLSGSTVIDISGEDNNGTLLDESGSGVTYDSVGRYLDFHGTGGTGDYIRAIMNNPSGAWTFTVSMWFKMDELQSDLGTATYTYNRREFFHFREDRNTSLTYAFAEVRDNRMFFYIGDSGNLYDSDFAPKQNTWHHMVVSYGGSAGTAKVFIDNVDYTSYITWTTGTLNLSANETLNIGRDGRGNSYWDGGISNFKIWGGIALTAEEVAMEYALGRTGKSVNLTDTSLCLGGTAPRAQLDVRGGAFFDGQVHMRNADALVLSSTTLINDIVYAENSSDPESSGNVVLRYDGVGSGTSNKFFIGSYYPSWPDPNGAGFTYEPSSGGVGIGTATPLAKLHVYTYSGAIGNGTRSYFRYGYSGVTTNTSTWASLSVYGRGSVGTGNYFVSSNGTVVSSDERIKKNIVDVDDAECLEVLRLLKPKKYQYKDEIERGQEPVWGFIAQEVRETLPYATQLRREVLPNIYELANVSSSNVITFTNFNTSNLESNATTLIRTRGIDDEDHDIHLAEVIDEHTIRVEEDLTEWIGSVDETGNVVTGNQLFVYGQEVDDFVYLKKESIWTVATAALQEVDRQLQAEKAKVATLETQLASVLARLDALENT